MMSDVPAADPPPRGMAPSRRSEASDESRQRILDAAEKLFIERGVSATSFARIERQAGISRGSIPWHFKNKRGLLLSILDRAMLLSTVDYADLHGNRRGLRGALHRARDRLRIPQAVLLAALLSESMQEESETHDRYRDFYRENRERVADLLGTIDGVTLPDGLDEDRVATLVCGALIGIHLQYRIAPDQVDLDAAIDDLADLLEHALGLS